MSRPRGVRAAAWVPCLAFAAALLAASCGDGGPSNDGATPGADPDGGTTTKDGAGGSDGGALADAGPIVAPQPLSAHIVVDQFGYRAGAEKIAVVRVARAGYDASGAAFVPGTTYALIDAHSGAKALEGPAAPWNKGATDPSSGDAAWWFDFSSVTRTGDYFLLDETNAVRSDVFAIRDDVYRDVLTATTRMFYYQRDGIAKDAKHAGAAWADGMAHPQDAACGLYSNGSAPRDLHGGWFDAGDQNRYTSWGASDGIELLRAYVEAPAAFADTTNIPESGNGVPDLLDEVKWEIDWVTRMQGTDGGVLSIAGHVGASPPSSDTSPCKYGPATTNATLASAALFAYAARVFRSVPAAAAAYPGYADALATRARQAWTWASANPNVTFYNAPNGVGAGEQEVDDAGRLLRKVQAAVFLFELTGDAAYKAVVDANVAPLQGSFDPFHPEQQETLLEYAGATGATADVAASVRAAFKSNLEGGGFAGMLRQNADPYGAYLATYVWGSNQTKAAMGNMFADLGVFGVDAAASAEMNRYAERYVHYVHGVNPLQLVYLTNMQALGANKCVTRIFHSWFAHGSRWDAPGVSTSGPPPGYLPGGANPAYAWDACCPAGCGSASNNALCGATPPSPPTGEPTQKSYKDFNDAWPLDSWQMAEPDDGYQARYVRLLAKFVH